MCVCDPFEVLYDSEHGGGAGICQLMGDNKQIHTHSLSQAMHTVFVCFSNTQIHMQGGICKLIGDNSTTGMTS